jgi:hypothetical protein
MQLLNSAILFVSDLKVEVHPFDCFALALTKLKGESAFPSTTANPLIEGPSTLTL